MNTTAAPPPLQELAAELQRQLETKKDIVADTRLTSFQGTRMPEAELAIDMPDGAQGFYLTRHAHQQMAVHLGIPIKLYDRLWAKHPELFIHLTTGLLNREPSKRMFRVLDDRIRAVLSDRYRPRDNWDLLEHMLPIIAEYPEVSFKECSLTDTRLYIKAYLPSFERQITPKVGDVIRGGIIISNSEVGSGALYIYPYTDRLACLNGMVHTDFGQRRIHVGKRLEQLEEAYEFFSDATLRLDDQAFFAKCADTLRGCLTETVFDAIAGQMRDLAEIAGLGSPIDRVEIIAKRERFDDDEKSSILQHVISGADLSAWGYLNGVTAMARDLDDADRRTQVEIAAGRMLAEPAWATVAA